MTRWEASGTMAVSLHVVKTELILTKIHLLVLILRASSRPHICTEKKENNVPLKI